MDYLVYFKNDEKFINFLLLLFAKNAIMMRNEDKRKEGYLR